MKHGIQLPACHIKVSNNAFPTPVDKANYCVSIFAQNSPSKVFSVKDQQRRATEESVTMCKDPLYDNNISINSAIALQYVSDSIVKLGKNIISRDRPDLTYHAEQSTR